MSTNHFRETSAFFFFYKYAYNAHGLPRWLSGKEFTYQAGDTGSVPGLGRFPGE